MVFVTRVRISRRQGARKRRHSGHVSGRSAKVGSRIPAAGSGDQHEKAGWVQPEGWAGIGFILPQQRRERY